MRPRVRNHNKMCRAPLSQVERRRWPRIPLAIPVFVRGNDPKGHGFEEFTAALNVSQGGLLLMMRRYIPVVTPIDLEIPSPSFAHVSGIPNFHKRIRGKVVSVATREPYRLYGVKFSRPLLKPPIAKARGKNLSSKWTTSSHPR